MGYYVSGSGDVRIAKEKLEAAYEALMKLNDVPDSKKNGGSFSGGGRTASWFSWMPQDLTTIPDAKAVFDRLGFETQYEDDCGLLVMSYFTSLSESVTARLNFLDIAALSSSRYTSPLSLVADFDIFDVGSCKSITRAPAFGCTAFGKTNVSPNR